MSRGTLQIAYQQEYKSPWYILGLQDGCSSKKDVTQAFRKLSLLLHPDHHMHEGPASVEYYTYEFTLISTARQKILTRERDWMRVAVKTGWRRPKCVEEYLRGGSNIQTGKFNTNGMSNRFTGNLGPGPNTSSGFGIRSNSGNNINFNSNTTNTSTNFSGFGAQPRDHSGGIFGNLFGTTVGRGASSNLSGSVFTSANKMPGFGSNVGNNLQGNSTGTSGSNNNGGPGAGPGASATASSAPAPPNINFFRTTGTTSNQTSSNAPVNNNSSKDSSNAAGTASGIGSKSNSSKSWHTTNTTASEKEKEKEKDLKEKEKGQQQTGQQSQTQQTGVGAKVQESKDNPSKEKVQEKSETSKRAAQWLEAQKRKRELEKNGNATAPTSLNFSSTTTGNNLNQNLKRKRDKESGPTVIDLDPDSDQVDEKDRDVEMNGTKKDKTKNYAKPGGGGGASPRFNTAQQQVPKSTNFSTGNTSFQKASTMVQNQNQTSRPTTGFFGIMKEKMPSFDLKLGERLFSKFGGGTSSNSNTKIETGSSSSSNSTTATVAGKTSSTTTSNTSNTANVSRDSSKEVNTNNLDHKFKVNSKKHSTANPFLQPDLNDPEVVAQIMRFKQQLQEKAAVQNVSQQFKRKRVDIIDMDDVEMNDVHSAESESDNNLNKKSSSKKLNQNLKNNHQNQSDPNSNRVRFPRVQPKIATKTTPKVILDAFMKASRLNENFSSNKTGTVTVTSTSSSTVNTVNPSKSASSSSSSKKIESNINNQSAAADPSHSIPVSSAQGVKAEPNAKRRRSTNPATKSDDVAGGFFSSGVGQTIPMPPSQSGNLKSTTVQTTLTPKMKQIPQSGTANIGNVQTVSESENQNQIHKDQTETIQTDKTSDPAPRSSNGPKPTLPTIPNLNHNASSPEPDCQYVVGGQTLRAHPSNGADSNYSDVIEMEVVADTPVNSNKNKAQSGTAITNRNVIDINTSEEEEDDVQFISASKGPDVTLRIGSAQAAKTTDPNYKLPSMMQQQQQNAQTNTTATTQNQNHSQNTLTSTSIPQQQAASTSWSVNFRQTNGSVFSSGMGIFKSNQNVNTIGKQNFSEPPIQNLNQQHSSKFGSSFQRQSVSNSMNSNSASGPGVPRLSFSNPVPSQPPIPQPPIPQPPQQATKTAPEKKQSDKDISIVRRNSTLNNSGVVIEDELNSESNQTNQTNQRNNNAQQQCQNQDLKKSLLRTQQVPYQGQDQHKQVDSQNDDAVINISSQQSDSEDDIIIPVPSQDEMASSIAAASQIQQQQVYQQIQQQQKQTQSQKSEPLIPPLQTKKETNYNRDLVNNLNNNTNNVPDKFDFKNGKSQLNESNNSIETPLLPRNPEELFQNFNLNNDSKSANRKSGSQRDADFLGSRMPMNNNVSNDQTNKSSQPNPVTAEKGFYRPQQQQNHSSIIQGQYQGSSMPQMSSTDPTSKNPIINGPVPQVTQASNSQSWHFNNLMTSNTIQKSNKFNQQQQQQQFNTNLQTGSKNVSKFTNSSESDVEMKDVTPPRSAVDIDRDTGRSAYNNTNQQQNQIQNLIVMNPQSRGSGIQIGTNQNLLIQSARPSPKAQGPGSSMGQQHPIPKSQGLSVKPDFQNITINSANCHLNNIKLNHNAQAKVYTSSQDNTRKRSLSAPRNRIINGNESNSIVKPLFPVSTNNKNNISTNQQQQQNKTSTFDNFSDSLANVLNDTVIEINYTQASQSNNSQCQVEGSGSGAAVPLSSPRLNTNTGPSTSDGSFSSCLGVRLKIEELISHFELYDQAQKLGPTSSESLSDSLLLFNKTSLAEELAKALREIIIALRKRADRSQGMSIYDVFSGTTSSSNSFVNGISGGGMTSEYVITNRKIVLQVESVVREFAGRGKFFEIWQMGKKGREKIRLKENG